MRYLGTPYTRLNSNQNRILTYWKTIKVLEKELQHCKEQREKEISYRIKKFFKKSKDRFLSLVHTDLMALRDMLFVWEC